MFSRKLKAIATANTIIVNSHNHHLLPQLLLEKVKKFLKNCQPNHWFDGFMDDVVIELKEF